MTVRRATAGPPSQPTSKFTASPRGMQMALTMFDATVHVATDGLSYTYGGLAG